MTVSSANPRAITIDVAGDVCLDVLGVPVAAKVSGSNCDDNWRQTGEIRTYYLRGGAYLLEHFVRAALDALKCTPQRIVFGPRPGRPQQLANEFDGPNGQILSVEDFLKIAERLTRDEIVHSLLKANEFPADADHKKELRLRVEMTQGFSGPKEKDPSLIVHPPQAKERVDVIVLDDTGNRFRRSESEWLASIQQIKRSAKDHEVTPVVIYKLHRPLPMPPVKGGPPALTNPLWDCVKRHFANDRIVIVSVDDLRDCDVVISRGLSWERTALDVVWQLLNSERLAELRNCSHLIIRFGLNGALYWRHDLINMKAKENDPKTNAGKTMERNTAWLIYDPQGIEGTGEQAYQGLMVGYGSVFTAAVAASVACAECDLATVNDKDGIPMAPADCIRQGIQAGLSAVRRLLHLGYGTCDPQTDPNYPGMELFQDVDLKQLDHDFPCQPVPILPEALIPDRGYWRLLDSIFRGKKDLLEVAVTMTARGAKPDTPEEKEAEKRLKSVPRAVFAKALCTYDRSEVENYRALYSLMYAYLQLVKVQRPLSVAVFGPPGAGKSFGVKKVAEALGEVSGPRKLKSLTFNLSQYNHPDQLAEAFHEVRDVVLAGDIPLVFFDEFDAALAGTKLGWLKYFLAPMQDAEFLDDGVPHPIGQAIFVFAGGTSSCYAEFARPFLATQPGKQESPEEFQGLKRAFKDAKGPDFLSRLRGFLDIPGLDLEAEFDAYGPVEAFPCPAAILLRRAGILNFQIAEKAPHLKNAAGALLVKPNVLKALLYAPQFIHGNRSFEALLDMSSLPSALQFTPSDLPSRTHTILHANSDQLNQLLTTGYPFPSEDRETIAQAIHEMYLSDAGTLNPQANRAHHPWDQLDADLQESNREQADHIAVKLRMIGLWFRKTASRNIQSPAVAVMRNKENLKTMAIAEHARWTTERRRDGWVAGPDNTKASCNEALKIHNCLFPWDELTKAQQQQDIDTVNSIPEFLAASGYEIIKL